MAPTSQNFGATLLLTRPKIDSLRVLDRLTRRLGCTPIHVIAPLIEIEPTDVAVYPAGEVALTSANGARRAAALGFKGRAWCVGPYTSEVAENLGFDAVAAEGTGASLAQLIVHQRANAAPLTHIRGEHRSYDLARALAASGIRCQEVVAYRQVAKPLSKAARDLIAAPMPVVIPLFSPRTAQLFWENAPQLKDTDHIVAISGAAAKGAAGRIHIAARPNLDHMCRLIAELLHPTGSVDRARSD